MSYIISPEGLAPAQISGEACASCGKGWPLPSVCIGRLPDGETVRCCPECAQSVALYRSEAAPAS
jgi:hypothetical protein